MTSKVFHRRTKRGAVMKIVREHYLRDDIPCGFEGCEKCAEIVPLNDIEVLIEKSPRTGLSTVYKNRHIVVPSASALIQQLDIFSDVDFGPNMIFLQSVISEIRQYNLNLYAKIKELINNKPRRIYVFSNEFHKDTFKTRGMGETVPDYADKLFKAAVLWYRRHLSGVEIVPIDSIEHEDIGAITSAKYVNTLKSNINLLDKLVTAEEKLDLTQETYFYPEHESSAAINGGVKQGKYYQGKMEVSRSNYLEASVSVMLKNERVKVLIEGRENMNRAVHEDVVAIELLPESEWGSTVKMMLDPEMDDEEEGDSKFKYIFQNLGKKTETTVVQPKGRVVGIIRRTYKQYCGQLKQKSDVIVKNTLVYNHMFVPSDKRYPLVRIETRQYEALLNQRIVVTIDSWPRNSKFPKGHYVRALGEIGTADAEREAILLEHEVPYQKFTPEVLKCLPKDPDNWKG